MSRKAIQATGAVAVGPYSHAVDSGDLVFLSGQTPIDSNTGQLIIGDIMAQTKQCFINLFNVLESCGLSSDQVQKVNVFLTDMSYFKEMNEVYETMFTPPYPARTTIGVASLPLGASVEIELIAKNKAKILKL
ncbi:MAG TPA: reactive intermediate/imine deaminase [Clostridiales bacterium UBA8960]|jgi:2-iminobutanoate/2-iminopropanoate deaminase|nr:reactive intermediate/imine deaminase [Clostridiales bacterium UBA8960]